MRHLTPSLLTALGVLIIAAPWSAAQPRHWPYGGSAQTNGSRWSDEDDERFGNEDEKPYDGIPRSADLVERDTGKIKFRAPSVGRIWIADHDKRRQIVAAQVRRGDNVVIEPDKDRIKVNDEIIYDRNLERKHVHDIFFRHDRNADHDADGGNTYDGIPTSARRVKSGVGTVKYEAQKDGRIYIGDDDRERQLVSKPVVKGDKIEIDSSRDSIKLNGESIYDRNLNSDNSHSIFFRSESRPGGGSGGSGGSGGGGGGGGGKPGNETPTTSKPQKPAAGTPGPGLPSHVKGGDRVAKGKGVLTYTAKANGGYWVYDPHEKRIIYTGSLKSGETVRVDPANNSVTAPSPGNARENFIASHEHEIYFRKE